MNRNEAIMLLEILKTEYPLSFSQFTKESAQVHLNLFISAFKDADFDLVKLAIEKIIFTDTSTRAPNIAKIREVMVELSDSSMNMTEQEAWSAILKAIKNGIYGSEEEYDQLPDICKRIVGSSDQIRDWAMMDSDEVHSVVASNVQRSFRVALKQEKEYQALPDFMKKEIKTIGYRTNNGMLSVGKSSCKEDE